MCRRRASISKLLIECRMKSFQMGRTFSELVFGRLVLLYQMPKTGSQSIEATLREHGGFKHILRLHFLSEQNAGHLRRVMKWQTAKPEWKREAVRQDRELTCFARALRLRRFLVKAGVPIPRLRVVTAVREAIGAILSNLFENHQLFVHAPAALTADKCAELLNRPRLCAQFHNWFEVELFPEIGIDVYRTPFPVEKGFCTYRNRLARVLLYRFENFSQLKPALEEFFGCKLDSIRRRNAAGEKVYGKFYTELKATLSLPTEFVREQLETRLMQHFYSQDERAFFFSKWVKGELALTGEGSGSSPSTEKALSLSH